MLDIAHAPPTDRAQIAQFMQNAFPRAKWDRSGWDAILSGRWHAADDSFAITVRDKGRLVGVLGLVTASRPTAAGLVKTANMTSWYVDKAYRGQGVGSRMLELATADPDITVTNFSSAKGAVPVVERAGFSVLDRARMIWRPRAGTAAYRVHSDPLSLGAVLPARDARILSDHAGLNLRSSAVETPSGLCTLILSVKQKHDDYVTFETMYLGDRALFSEYARKIAASILPPTGAVLSVDRRFVAPGTSCDGTEDFAVPRYYTAGRMPAADVDHLYSEIVLLGLKMY
jgi:ribosomal protein S18 acetylase RimI-like enzyme